MATITQRVVDRVRELGGEIYAHGQWGSVRRDVYANRRRTRPVNVKKADTFVAHITVTNSPGSSLADFKEHMRTVESIGFARFGSGFSYNFGIRGGRIGVGQPLDAKGTHTLNNKGVPGYSFDQNHAARAFAFLGNVGDRFTAEDRRAAVILMAAMILEDALTEDPDVVPHSLFAAKDCPTDTVRDVLPEIKRDALELVRQVRAGVDDEEGVEFGLATLNIRHALKPADVIADIEALTDRPAVSLIALQEMGGRRDLLERVAESEGFDLLMPEVPDVSGEGSTPILIRRGVWELKRSEALQATDRTEVPDRAAGPSNMPPKFVTVAHLTHLPTGRTLHLYNGHWPASQHIGEMRDLADHMTAVVAEAESDDTGAVIVCGDFNTARPLELADGALDEAGLVDLFDARNPKLPTFKKRDIDHVLHRGSVLDPVAAWVLTGFNSDHRPLLGKFRLSVKAKAKR